MKSFFLTILVFTIPLAVFGADRLVSCDGPDCDIDAFIKMINNIINWIIGISITIFAISLIWGGFLYMTSGENPGNKEKAKTIIWSTLKGFVIILVAWVIVYTILNTLVKDPGSNSIFEFIDKS